jgi:ABC-2 type transport system ATP-binding protein
LEVRQGEVFGFLGPNGAGKTTTIKAITGLIRPDAGSISVCGLPHRSREAKRRMGFMAEGAYYYSHLSGREYLMFHSRLLGLDRRRAEERAARLLERVGVSRAADARMQTYSKGMLQRISFALALLGEPELLILDEPMSALDPLGRRDFRDLILELRDAGTTVFFSSHIIPDVETICDRVALLVGGRVLATGSVRELLSAQAELYEVTFTGAEPGSLATPLDSSQTGREASWVRVREEHKDAAVRELVGAGASIVGISVVRGSLEDFVLRHTREAGR